MTAEESLHPADRDLPGRLLVISGPSGVGKSTICRRLVDRLDAKLSVSATTRGKRPGEVDGRDYHFMTVEQFERDIERGGFLEYARVYGGRYYGTPAEATLESLRAGKIVILEIEIEGAIQVVRRFPDAMTVYVLAPSADEQQRRLEHRDADSEAAMAERLAHADGEIRYAKDCGVYGYFVENRVVEETVERIVRFVRREQEQSRA